MGTKTRVVLLCCGSFNPITNMHLRMFELARDYLNQTGHFQVVGGIISPVNDAYGKTDLISAKHRCEMVDLALSSSDWIRLDCWESDQEKWLTTVKVLTHHQNFLDSITNANDQTDSVPKKQKLDRENINCPPLNDSNTAYWDLSKPSKLMLLCGADLLESFGSPGLWSEDDLIHIVGRHGIVVISRQGNNPQQFVYESDLLSRYQHNIHNVTEWIPNEVSATRIRRAIRRRESVRYLLPDPVLQYIKDHDLYQTNNKYFDFTSTNITSPLQFYDHSFLHGNHGDKVGDMFIENEQETAV